SPSEPTPTRTPEAVAQAPVCELPTLPPAPATATFLAACSLASSPRGLAITTNGWLRARNLPGRPPPTRTAANARLAQPAGTDRFTPAFPDQFGAHASLADRSGQAAG